MTSRSEVRRPNHCATETSNAECYSHTNPQGVCSCISKLKVIFSMNLLHIQYKKPSCRSVAGIADRRTYCLTADFAFRRIHQPFYKYCHPVNLHSTHLSDCNFPTRMLSYIKIVSSFHMSSRCIFVYWLAFCHFSCKINKCMNE